MTKEQEKLLENFIRNEVRKSLKEEKKINSPNKDYMNSLTIESHWKFPEKFRAVTGGGVSVSILDLINQNKLFDTEKEATQYALKVYKDWSNLLDKYYRK